MQVAKHHARHQYGMKPINSHRWVWIEIDRWYLSGRIGGFSPQRCCTGYIDATVA
jgi:hypothetical protein